MHKGKLRMFKYPSLMPSSFQPMQHMRGIWWLTNGWTGSSCSLCSSSCVTGGCCRSAAHGGSRRYIAHESAGIVLSGEQGGHRTSGVLPSYSSSLTSSFSSSSTPPMDFNPHIEWFEYPKEIFDPKFPYTREESIRMTEEAWDSTMEEMASRYGMKLNMTTKPTFWMAWMIMCFYAWYTLWGAYRAMGLEPGWSHFRDIVLQSPHPPTLEEDDLFLDQWIRPEMREKFSRYERFWNWNPVVKRDGAHTSWKTENNPLDVSEWEHMASAH